MAEINNIEIANGIYACYDGNKGKVTLTEFGSNNPEVSFPPEAIDALSKLKTAIDAINAAELDER